MGLPLSSCNGALATSSVGSSSQNRRKFVRKPSCRSTTHRSGVTTNSDPATEPSRWPMCRSTLARLTQIALSTYDEILLPHTLRSHQ